MGFQESGLALAKVPMPNPNVAPKVAKAVSESSAACAGRRRMSSLLIRRAGVPAGCGLGSHAAVARTGSAAAVRNISPSPLPLFLQVFILKGFKFNIFGCVDFKGVADRRCR